MLRALRIRTAAGGDSEAGVALVEFALVLPLLLLLLFGMLDFGKAFNYWIDETHLANEGARWAGVNKNPGSGYAPGSTSSSRPTRPSCATAAPHPCRAPLQVCISFPERQRRGRRPGPGDRERHLQLAALPRLAGRDHPRPRSPAPATMRLEARPTSLRGGVLVAHRGRTRLDGERGGVLVMVALWLPGAACCSSTFVVDVGNWFVHKRHLQMQADAAALAGGGLFTLPVHRRPDPRPRRACTPATPANGAPYNLQVAADRQANVHVLVNSDAYYERGRHRTHSRRRPALRAPA